jgi:hypothetical protein
MLARVQPDPNSSNVELSTGRRGGKCAHSRSLLLPRALHGSIIAEKTELRQCRDLGTI